MRISAVYVCECGKKKTSVGKHKPCPRPSPICVQYLRGAAVYPRPSHTTNFIAFKSNKKKIYAFEYQISHTDNEFCFVNLYTICSVRPSVSLTQLSIYPESKHNLNKFTKFTQSLKCTARPSFPKPNSL